MKNMYEMPIAEILAVSTKDVITVSDGGQYDEKSNAIMWEDVADSLGM